MVASVVAVVVIAVCVSERIPPAAEPLLFLNYIVQYLFLSRHISPAVVSVAVHSTPPQCCIPSSPQCTVRKFNRLRIQDFWVQRTRRGFDFFPRESMVYIVCFRNAIL